MQDRDTIDGIWFRRALRNYPDQSAEFLAGESDPFRNPVGNTIRRALSTLLEELLLGMDQSRITGALDSLMQIQAVQDQAPSRALDFLFQLKDILRLQAAGQEPDLLNGRIDEMALAATDLFMKYRKRTWEARANEARRRTYVMERRLAWWGRRFRLPAASAPGAACLTGENACPANQQRLDHLRGPGPGRPAACLRAGESACPTNTAGRERGGG
jgi:hypothetical protein